MVCTVAALSCKAAQIRPELQHSGSGEAMRITVRFLVIGLAMVVAGLCANDALAGAWMAHADFSNCPSQYIPQSSGEEGPFATESDCEARISEVESASPLACAQYECDQEGDDSSADTGGSIPSIPIPSGGLTTQQQVGLGLGLLGAYMVGAGLHALLAGNPQQKAAERARQAALAAAQRRKAAEKQRQLEATRDRLLREIKGTPGSSEHLALMGVDSQPQLQLMTGAQALTPMTASIQKTAHPAANPDAKKKVKHTDAFNKGYYDGSQCYSQSAGPYCNGLSGDKWQTCLADYRAGYEVGTKEMKMKVDEATQTGLIDKELGKPNEGFVDVQDVGDCRTELTQAYNNGYMKAQLARDSAGLR